MALDMDIDVGMPDTTHDPASSSSSRTAALHRIRFVDYSPFSITSLALTPSSYDPNIHYPYLPSINTPNGREILAVGRQNGDVEIYTWIGGLGGKKTRNGNGKGKGKAATEGNRQGWVLERKLASPHPSRVEHLLFTHQTILSESDKDLFDEPEQVRELEKLRRDRPRLFSAGGGSDLWEWDWKDGGLGFVKRTLSSQGGAIWSLAANPTHTTLALGCDDGAVRLVSLWDGELEHVRKFDPVRTRLLSLAWGPQTVVAKSKGKARGMEIDGEASGGEESSDTTYEDSLLVTGCADSTVRIWDPRSGRCTYRMTTDKIRSEQTLVWCIAVLRDGTIVSGDSMGLVKFWDSKMGTQLQSLAVSKADVLCLAVGPDGKSIYSSGVDQKTTQLQYMPVKTSSKTKEDRARWVIVHSKRMHSHDVRSIAVSPSYSLSPSSSSPSSFISSARVPVVISGGLDFSLIYTSASTANTDFPNPISDSNTTVFGETFHRKTSYIPHRSSPASLAKEVKLLVSRTEKGVDVWKIQGGKKEDGGWKKVLEMELKTKTSLTSSAISGDGEWLAVSDLMETKVFRLKWSSDGSLKARKSQAVASALASQAQLNNDLGASQLHFTSDSSRLILATAVGSRIVVVSLPETSDDEASVLRIFNQHRLGSRQNSGRAVAGMKQVNGKDGSDDESSEGSSDDDDSPTENEDSISSIACLSTSSDGQWLVSSDFSCRLHVYNLDSLHHHSALPSLELPAVSLAFSPSSPSILTVGLQNNTIQFFDVDSRSIPSWANRISASPTGALTTLREPMLGMAYDPMPKGQDTLLLYGSTWLCKMKVPIASTTTTDPKRKRLAEEGESVPEVVRYKGTPAEVGHKYQPMLLLDFTSDGEMVVVERPIFNMLGGMAPAFTEHKYGS